jgi:spore maturation protein CgeB
LLTDIQSDVFELFDFGNECVTFAKPGGLDHLISHYETREELRESIANNARKVILGNHTYYHRMLQITQVIRDRYS